MIFENEKWSIILNCYRKMWTTITYCMICYFLDNKDSLLLTLDNKVSLLWAKVTKLCCSALQGSPILHEGFSCFLAFLGLVLFRAKARTWLGLVLFRAKSTYEGLVLFHRLKYQVLQPFHPQKLFTTLPFFFLTWCPEWKYCYNYYLLT